MFCFVQLNKLSCSGNKKKGVFFFEVNHLLHVGDQGLELGHLLVNHQNRRSEIIHVWALDYQCEGCELESLPKPYSEKFSKSYISRTEQNHCQNHYVVLYLTNQKDTFQRHRIFRFSRSTTSLTLVTKASAYSTASSTTKTVGPKNSMFGL